MQKDREDLLPTRQSLLSRLKQWDDQESWRDFFNTYWKLIYGTALKSGLSDVEAQEAVQSRKRSTLNAQLSTFRGT